MGKLLGSYDLMKGKVGGWWNKIFTEISGQCYMVFCLFSSVVDRLVLILVWFERSLHSAQVSGQSCS